MALKYLADLRGSNIDPADINQSDHILKIFQEPVNMPMPQ
jgi:hypothetical protein